MVEAQTEVWDVLDEHGIKTGRTALGERWKAAGEYHLVVHVWIVNSQGKYLISKRASHKSFPDMWETCRGSVIAGEDSLSGAIREVREELGIALEPQNGYLLRRYKHDDFPYLVDVWLFRQEVFLAQVVCQPNETSGAMLATRAEIERMIREGMFLGRDIFPCLDEVFGACSLCL